MPKLQEAGTSRAGGASYNPVVDTDVAKSRTGREPGRPPNPQARTGRTSQVIALKDGDSLPDGYVRVVETRPEIAPLTRNQPRSAVDTVDLSTPPNTHEPRIEEDPQSAKSKTAARRNLTRNTNRKANATFARELKESLATGEPCPIKVAEDQGDLRGAWHSAAKEVAYKFLDLTKESWKEFSMFEKSVVHKEINEQYKFDPPISPKRIDKYLSGHLRTSRAVWKAHWKKFGPSERHHNCPKVAWDRLCKWWPTSACQAEAAEMACRRAKVERGSKVGRSSLLDRMDEKVSRNPVMGDVYYFFNYHSLLG